MKLIIDGERLPKEEFIEVMEKAATLCLDRENVKVIIYLK